MLGSLSFKLRVLAKQVSKDFMHSFLGLVIPGDMPFPAQGPPTSSIVSGLGEAGEGRQPRDQETFCRQNEDSG